MKVEVVYTSELDVIFGILSMNIEASINDQLSLREG